jgi:hypothetical protein
MPVFIGVQHGKHIAFDVAYQLSHPFYHGSFGFVVRHQEETFWADLSERVVKACLGSLSELAPTDLYLASVAYERGDASIKQVLAWHTVRSLFRAPYSRVFFVWRPPLAIRLLLRWWRIYPDSAPEALYEDLSVLGSYLVALSPPWADLRSEGSGPEYRVFTRDVISSGTHEGPARASLRPLSPAAAYGVFAILAVLLEDAEEGYRKQVLLALERIMEPQISLVRGALLVRFDPKKESYWNGEVFADPYRQSIEAWVKSEVSFVKRPGTAKVATSYEVTSELEFGLKDDDEEVP